MSAAFMSAGIVAVAAMLALLGSLGRVRSWRHGVVWGQLLLAVSFYALLFPPHTKLRSDALTVVTPGASSGQLRALPHAQRVVVLPGGPAVSSATRVPDLASALRGTPDVRRVSVVGAGLPARDQTAGAAKIASLDAAPVHGIVELLSPASAALGTQWTVSGRVAEAGVSVELLDPSAKVIDSAKVDDEGRFRLSAEARGSGPARFELRALDDRRRIIDVAAVPIVVRGGETLEIIVRAGAPDPELKYFRRWAVDAGLSVRSSAGLSTDITLRDGDTRLTTDVLGRADLVIIDERAWRSLGADEKDALRVAVEAGLGLLLRVGGPVDAAVSAEWDGYGFRFETIDAPRAVTLDRRFVTHERGTFTAAPVAVRATGATPLLASDEGDPLAWWHDAGRGRVGLWILTDSYRLMLLGESAVYGTLWSDAIATLARARPVAPQLRLPGLSWTDERAVICGLGSAAQVMSPGGGVTALVVDASGCAAYWPSAAGWHEVQSNAQHAAFYVRAAGDGEGLRAARNARATQQLLQAEAAVSPAVFNDEMSMSRWPFFALWLLLAGAVWWRERG